MATTIDTEALKKAWFTFEEIQRIKASIEDFDNTWIAYPVDDVFARLNEKIFSQYSVPCIK